MRRTQDRDHLLRELNALMARYHGRRHELLELVNAVPLGSRGDRDDLVSRY